jgi:hypothetical protein
VGGSPKAREVWRRLFAQSDDEMIAGMRGIWRVACFEQALSGDVGEGSLGIMGAGCTCVNEDGEILFYQRL